MFPIELFNGLRAARFTRVLKLLAFTCCCLNMFESCAVYEGAQTSFANKYTRISFESCVVYNGTQTRPLSSTTPSLFESCAIYKGAQSAQDNAQVCAQVLFTRLPTLIPFVPLSSVLLDTEPMIGILNIRNVSIVATWHRFFSQS